MDRTTRSPLASEWARQSGSLPVLFGEQDRLPGTPPQHGEDTGPDFEAIQRSPEFVALRRRHRRFVFPMSLLFLSWYLTYVLLAAYAHDVMSKPLLGEINVGIAMGILQFLTTMAITIAYLRFARNRLDPQAAQLRRSAGMGG